MKETLLSIVQDILSDMDSDLVNTIMDTPESEQVAQIVKRTYYDLVTTREWPHFRKLDQLDSASVARPTHMAIRANTMRILDVKYNKAKLGETRVSYQRVEYMDPEDFLAMLERRDTTKDNITTVVDPSGVTLAIVNDTSPQYWTSFDDNTIVFDSYDSAVDNFLQNSKTSLLAYKIPEWVMEDEHIPDFPTEAFSLLIAESKSRAFNALAQEINQKAEQQSYASRRYLSNANWKTRGNVTYPNYGRKSRK